MQVMDVIWSLIYGFGSLTSGLSNIVFWEIPLIEMSLFDFMFSPATWIVVFGLLITKKLVPLT